MASTRKIIITGGSSGIGEAIAVEMAKDQHIFYLTGRNEENLGKVAQKVHKLGGVAYYGVGDVGSEEDVDRVFKNAQDELGGVDVLIANAGVGYFGPLEEISTAQFDSQFNTNVRGVFLWMKKVLPIMKKRNSGQIIVTSSNLGLIWAPRASIYSATKYAVQAMVWCVRAELRGISKVKVSTINPGSVDTPWFDGKSSDRTKMLSPLDVAKAARLIIDQEESSNIDHILLHPGD
ncbi:MAG: SDR family oxidoreductase [Candidatus Hodarchaeales archaeon]